MPTDAQLETIDEECDRVLHQNWRERRFTYNVTSVDATMTASIQPPLLAWAWRIAVGDGRA